mgnify:FL=1
MNMLIGFLIGRCLGNAFCFILEIVVKLISWIAIAVGWLLGRIIECVVWIFKKSCHAIRHTSGDMA